MDHKSKGLKFLLIGLLVFAILSTACSAGKKNQDPPKFYARHTSVDVGDVYEGQDITYSYTIRNNGAGELHIINVRPG
jgi:ABC-type transporter Mla subunit MlaD